MKKHLASAFAACSSFIRNAAKATQLVSAAFKKPAAKYVASNCGAQADPKSAPNRSDPCQGNSTLFDCALAAGPSLLEACILTQQAGSLSVLKTLRLVSKAASVIALQAVTGFSLHLDNRLCGKHDCDFSELVALLGCARVNRLTVIVSQYQDTRADGGLSGMLRRNNL